MEKRPRRLSTSQNFTYLKFACSSLLPCKDLKDILARRFNTTIDCILDRDAENFMNCQSGLICIDGSDFPIEPIKLGIQDVNLIPVSEKTFYESSKQRNLLIYFEGSHKFAKIENISKLASHFGKVINIGNFVISRNEEGVPKSYGYISYSNAVEAERFLSFYNKGLLDFRIVRYGSQDLKQSLSSLDKYSLEKQDQCKFSALRKRKTIDMRPKLDFSKHSQNIKNDHAFGGFYIRPYLRAAEAIHKNSAGYESIQFNILSPKLQKNLLQCKSFR